MEGNSGSVEPVAGKVINVPRIHESTDMRPNLKEHSILMNLAWKSKEELEIFDSTFWKSPFNICEISDFLSNDDFLEDLAKNAKNFPMAEKTTDLYKFRQSDDLANIDDPLVRILLDFLKNSCRTWIEEVTGFELTDQVSATFSAYKLTDFLLCHDDRCEDRKVAFILYCTKNWKDPTDGGALQLYNIGGDEGKPRDIVKNIYPNFNKFVFFEVSHISHHSVQEVLEYNKTRLSVNGWFHCGAVHNIPYVIRDVDPLMSNFLPPEDLVGKEIRNIIHRQYFLPERQDSIKEHFSEESEVLLEDFFGTQYLMQLISDLKNCEWKSVGPANRRRFQVLDRYGGNPPELRNLLRSQAMYDFLSKLTGLEFKRNEETGMPKCSAEIAKWEPTSYTVLSDADVPTDGYVLDLMIFVEAIMIEGDDIGGNIVYIDGEDGSQLLSIPPTHNSAALVYRDSKTKRFMQYLSYMSLVDQYYVFFATYKE